MTSAPHPVGGPDVAVLADLSAQLLPPTADRSARAHVESCAECTAVLQALDRTGRELRWLPPIPMPAEVTARIDEALAAERTIVSISHLRERRKRRQQLLGVAAAALVVLGGGGVLLSSLTGGTPDSVTAGVDTHTEPAPPSSGPSLDEGSLPDAVADLVTGGEGGAPLDLDGTPAPQNCVASVQLDGLDELIGVIEIRYGGRNRDAVFFTTSNATMARVIVVEDCSVPNPVIVATLKGEI